MNPNLPSFDDPADPQNQDALGRPFGATLRELSVRFYQGIHAPSRKPTCYLEEYERLFHRIRHLPLQIVELGVQGGWSMLMWREYFPAATIIGVDVADKPATFPEEPRFHFVQADQNDPRLGQMIGDLAGGPLDAVIDDASHIGFYTGKSFRSLFPLVKPGGTYVIEDIATSFTGCGDFDDAPFLATEIGIDGMPKVFPSHQHGIVGLVKQLADYTQSTVALKQNAWSNWPIYRVSFLPNMAVISKCGGHLIAGH
jgi:hypothetical protein